MTITAFNIFVSTVVERGYANTRGDVTNARNVMAVVFVNTRGSTQIVRNVKGLGSAFIIGTELYVRIAEALHYAYTTKQEIRAPFARHTNVTSVSFPSYIMQSMGSAYVPSVIPTPTRRGNFKRTEQSIKSICTYQKPSKTLPSTMWEHIPPFFLVAIANAQIPLSSKTTA